MAAHPPSKPHVEGDGFSQPHVLHWESPGTRGINGYSVQVKVDGPAGDGKFHSLLADTKSKSTKASLSSLTLSAGHSYTFRVAAHISGWAVQRAERADPGRRRRRRQQAVVAAGSPALRANGRRRRRRVEQRGAGERGGPQSGTRRLGDRLQADPRPFGVRQRPARVGRLPGARQEVQGREARRPRRRRPRKRRRRPERHDAAERGATAAAGGATAAAAATAAARARGAGRRRSRRVRAAREGGASGASALAMGHEFYRRQNRRPRPEERTASRFMRNLGSTSPPRMNWRG